MATSIKKGQHLFFVFENGVATRNRQNKLRCYFSRKRAEERSNGIGEIVEYEPVINARWRWKKGTFASWACDNCDARTDFNPGWKNRCPHCGAHMIEWEDSNGVRHSVQG